ncbi:hypothetical protein AK812_SmicGene3975 [Symbiodinium microadriaticum]|uniref:Uncharacterized protein n=1 Tax=Symbiodinium microadriaticum TaxID=2951 RepID=A0A1Q9EXQ2_SYMMI|nr:hypothetical protein AK812_SmicGene3975 [Symbiodinium microadriaticum]
MTDVSAKRGEVPSHSGGESPQKWTKSGGAPSSKGQGKGKQQGQRRGEGRSSDVNEDDLVNAVARLVLRHDEQLLALTSDLCFVSYVRTEGHSVLQELHAESKKQRGLMAPTSPPRHALTLRFFRTLKDRIVKVSQSEAIQKQLQQEGVMTMHGEWPYLEWNTGSQSTVESLEVTMFKTSRPLGDKMTGGQAALQRLFACSRTSLSMFQLSLRLSRSVRTLLPIAIMAYRLQPTRLVEVLLPVLAALYHETEVPAGEESLPGSYLTQIKTLVETRLVRIKDVTLNAAISEWELRLNEGGEMGRSSVYCTKVAHSRQPRFPKYASTGELPPVSFTTGACARGPNVGITRNMKEFPRVTQVLAMVIHAIDPEHRFSSCSLTLNVGASAHRDSHNARGSYNLLVPCSMFQGGGLWLQNDRGSVQLESGGPLGSVMDVASPIRFRPLQQHATMPWPWHGNRLVLVAFHARHLSNLPVEDLVDLADCGFSLDPGLD